MAPEPAMDCARARVPTATYRLQLNRLFTFEQAAGLVGYLDALGVSDVYTSSYLAARPGSLHGYDIVDHTRLNPEIGSPETHRAFTDALAARDLGHILDVVPNHMGIGHVTNRWWQDVLEHGPSSPYADFFDIDWDPVERHLADKVLLPILGDQYGRVLERQELTLEYEQGAFRIRYHDTLLPVEPRSAAVLLEHAVPGLDETLGDDHPDLMEYRSILTALANLPAPTERGPERSRERMREQAVIRRRLQALVERGEAVRAAIEETVRVANGKPGDPRSFDLLDGLLADQPYRLAHWQVAAEEVNYRRFFDINELAAIRMELPAVFRETHRLILGFVETGQVTGLRIDHPDGLYDPRGYLLALQRERFAQCLRARYRCDGVTEGPDLERAVAEAAEAFEARCDRDPTGADCRPLYVVAEKVLARGERLPAGWAIHGTTGYEFLNLVNGLFVDGAHAKAMTAAYARFTGERAAWADVVYASKQLVVESAMASELEVLGHALARLAQKNRASRDFTRRSLTGALREIIACFPLYRTYIADDDADVALQDRACVEVALAFARRRNPTTSASIFDFVRDVLLLRYPEAADPAYRKEQLRFVGKFQQLTAPVTAKGVEDTAGYRYHRLVSLNEVGGDPDQFGVSVEEFHQRCLARQRDWPAALSATSTHDTKRGEDVRARIHVLSEIPRAWRDAVRRWHRYNARHAARLDGRRAPDRNDEYLLYQTLVGAWPLEPMTHAAAATFTERIQAYMTKAAKEAKVHTSWINPDAAYDLALRRFVEGVLQPGPANRFLADFVAFHEPIARAGMVNGLAQTAIKLTAPGVPDIYQGAELWDLRLVDPDNRGPIAWDARAAALDDLARRLREGDRAALSQTLLASWPDGRVKLYVIHRALAERRRAPALFREGEYVPLGAAGPQAGHVCAFARRHGARRAIIVVPRLVTRLAGPTARLPLGEAVWADTAVRLPPGLGGTLVDAFTGATIRVPDDRDATVAVGEALARFPVAVLITEDAA
jgi:(1->4)-alpha-D-glucan 1-alpha-D-glucosylmutase